MRKIALTLALLGATMMTSCMAGPRQLSRSVDDWDHKLYVESPWLDAGLWVLPVIPLAKGAAAFGDFFIGAYTFWGKDAWSDQGGTGFRHASPEAKNTMGSMFTGDGSFLKIDSE